MIKASQKSFFIAGIFLALIMIENNIQVTFWNVINLGLFVLSTQFGFYCYFKEKKDE